MDQRAIRAWDRDAQLTITTSIARFQSELEALRDCVIDGETISCLFQGELSAEALWHIRAGLVSRLRPQITASADSLYADDEGIRSGTRFEIWLEFEDIERSLHELGDHVTAQDEAAFQEEILELKSYVSRASITARDYGLDVPGTDWPPAESIFVER